MWPFRKHIPDQWPQIGVSDPDPEQRDRYYEQLAEHIRNKMPQPEKQNDRFDQVLMVCFWILVTLGCLIVWRFLV